MRVYIGPIPPLTEEAELQKLFAGLSASPVIQRDRLTQRSLGYAVAEADESQAEQLRAKFDGVTFNGSTLVVTIL